MYVKFLCINPRLCVLAYFLLICLFINIFVRLSKSNDLREHMCLKSPIIQSVA